MKFALTTGLVGLATATICPYRCDRFPDTCALANSCDCFEWDTAITGCLLETEGCVNVAVAGTCLDGTVAADRSTDDCVDVAYEFSVWCAVPGNSDLNPACATVGVNPCTTPTLNGVVIDVSGGIAEGV